MLSQGSTTFLVCLPFYVWAGIKFDQSLFKGNRPPFWSYCGLLALAMNTGYMVFELVERMI